MLGIRKRGVKDDILVVSLGGIDIRYIGGEKIWKEVGKIMSLIWYVVFF